MKDIANIREELLDVIQTSDNPREVLKSPLLKSLYDDIKQVAPEQKAEYGRIVKD
jgi:hypothetical protein